MPELHPSDGVPGALEAADLWNQQLPPFLPGVHGPKGHLSDGARENRTGRLPIRPGAQLYDCLRW